MTIPSTPARDAARTVHERFFGAILQLALDRCRNVYGRAARNITIDSDAIDAGSWTSLSETTVTADQLTAPDGTLTAEKIEHTPFTGDVEVGRKKSVSAPAQSTDYTWSVHVHAGTSKFAGISTFKFDNGASSSGIEVDLDTGAITIVGIAPDASSAERVCGGDGKWWRLSITRRDNPGEGTVDWKIHVLDGNGDLNDNVSGANIFFWRAMLQIGTVLGPAIKTTAAAVSQGCRAGLNRKVAVRGSTANTVTLDLGASAIDDFYNNKHITIREDTDDQEEALIDDYVGATRLATVKALTQDGNWILNPTATAEEITNGDFPTDLTGWDDDSTGTGTFLWQSPGQARVQASPSPPGVGIGTKVITLSAGRFVLTWTTVLGSTIKTRLGTTRGASDILSELLSDGSGREFTLASGQTVYLQFLHDSPAAKEFDDVSLLLAEHAIHDTDSPTACYNTFSTCQDTPNYNLGLHCYQFLTRGARIPIGQVATENLKPYLQSVPSAAVAVLDVKAGLSRRAALTATLIDEPLRDDEQDPYIANRTTPAGGTYWRRLIARNPFYAGRFATLRKGYIVDPWDFDTFLDELYIIKSIKGPDARANITVSLEDPLKLADRVQIPKSTDGKLSVAITSTALSLTLDSGKGSQYNDPAVTGEVEFVAISDEIINYTSISGDVLSWPATSNRGQFNTTAKAQSINAAVTLCRAFVGKTVKFIIKALLNEAGITDLNIDITGLDKEEDDWWGTKYLITTVIPRPERAGTLIAELVREANAYLWWQPQEQLVKIKVNMPELLSADPVLFEDAGELRELAVTKLDDARVTHATIHFDRITGTSNTREKKSFARSETIIDAAAEGPNEHGNRRAEVIYSRWLTNANSVAAKSLVVHQVAWRRDTTDKFIFSLDPKNYTIAIGDLIDIKSSKHLDENGAEKQVRTRITKWQDLGTHIEAEALSTTFARRYGFIAPNGNPNYDAQSKLQRRHASISDNTALMSDGSGAYLIS